MAVLTRDEQGTSNLSHTHFGQARRPSWRSTCLRRRSFRSLVFPPRKGWVHVCSQPLGLQGSEVPQLVAATMVASFKVASGRFLCDVRRGFMRNHAYQLVGSTGSPLTRSHPLWVSTSRRWSRAGHLIGADSFVRLALRDEQMSRDWQVDQTPTEANEPIRRLPITCPASWVVFGAEPGTKATSWTFGMWAGRRPSEATGGPDYAAITGVLDAEGFQGGKPTWAKPDPFFLV